MQNDWSYACPFKCVQRYAKTQTERERERETCPIQRPFQGTWIKATAVLHVSFIPKGFGGRFEFYRSCWVRDCSRTVKDTSIETR